MAVQYGDLVNKNGTIYNTKTGQGYSSPAALAADLGVSASAINWGQISSQPGYQPGETLGTTPSNQPSNNNSVGTISNVSTSTTTRPASTPAPTTPASTPPAGGLQMPAGYPASSTSTNPSGQTPGQTQTTNIAAQPPSTNFINSDAYKSLSPDEQAMINTMYNTYATGTAQQQNLLIQAVTAASANSDPYYKSLLDITMGEFGAKVAAENNDYGTQQQIIQTTQQQLLTNVNAQEGALTLENQADLAKIAINYNDDILNAQSSAANTGTAQGSGYGTLDYASNLLTAQQQNTVMSTNASYNYNIQALQLKASQGDVNAQLQLQQLTQQHNASIQNIGTSAEQEVGTANVGNIPGLTSAGYTALGGNNGSNSGNTGFLGQIGEQEQTDILTGVKNYLGISQPSVTATGS